MLINFISSFTVKERRHVIFLYCILAVLISTILNMISISFIENFKPEYKKIATVITTMYFVLLTSPAAMFSVYAYEFASLQKKYVRLISHIIYFPYFLYVVFVLLNLKYKWLFFYDLESGYNRGYLKNMTYATTAIYVVIVLIIAFVNRKHLSKKLFSVFVSYPIISIAVSTIQFFNAHMVMTGASAFSPLLLAYLAIQTDLLDYDLITGLMTEKHLTNYLAHKKETNLVFISIENYFTIYETIGYNESNYLLFQIAQKISSIFPKNAYHISSNRFAIVGRDMEKMKEGVLSICKDVQVLEVNKGVVFHIDTRCVGLNIPGNAQTYNNAMELASEMLSNAQKDKTKRDVKFLLSDEVYEDKVRRNNMIKKILERELNVDSKMYQVYFQPIYSISKDKYVYAEALSRLLDTEIGTIRPDEFIPVAESKGLIEKLGNVAFEKICKFIRDNRETVSAISVNFSVNQLTNPFIVETVLNTIAKYEIKPENIIMEITESIFIDDFESIKEKMLRLSEAGIIFYLDDFGTGYSNFANVIDLPFTTIKIDRSMVLSMESSEDSRRLIFSLISAFKQNGLNILVEGVENLEQDKLVREAGADYIQGFLYKRPLCEKDCLEIFKN